MDLESKRMRIYNNECIKTNFNNIDKYLSDCDKNYKLLCEIKNEALDRNELLGSIISFPVADGFAYYQVLKIKDNNAFVVVCKNLGDDYEEILIGKEGWIKLQFVKNQLELNNFFRKRGNI